MSQVGSIGNLESSDHESEHARAILWVPTPESRSGWREWYIFPAKPQQERRRLGW